MLTGFMAASSAVFLGLAWHFWIMPGPEIASRAILAWQPSAIFAKPEVVELGAQHALSEALARPLFRHSRRPFAPAPVTVAVAAPEPVIQPVMPPLEASQISVRGILIKGPSKQALLATPEKPDGTWMAVGTETMGWKIVGIDPNGVKISQGKQELELKLYVDNGLN